MIIAIWGLSAIIVAACLSVAPEGFEDERGFHRIEGE